MHAGETVGHYRVLHTLGKGGMGEVYAAEDTKLHRTVALKILPAVFASDPAFLERFQREAQAVAALNHPNIVTIYSVEENRGRPFITMECVEGRPLSDLIVGGGMPIDRILRTGIEVADAMASAQQRGITHRDLKPANIMIGVDGRAKVLDFGLAKERDLELAHGGDTVTRMSRELTGEGKILGTVAYMSPEQAEGKPVDPRSDIFSLGIILHEMATGERPFQGDTNVSVISSIIKDTPKPVTDINPALPADFARIVRRCLAKDPSRRYQTAADVRNELDELKQDTGSVAVGPGRPASKSSRSSFAWILTSIAGLGVAVMALLVVGREVGGRPRAAGFSIERIQRLTTTGTAYAAAISPDGRYVVHAKIVNHRSGLWTRQTATTSDVQIVPPADVHYAGITVSPDGNYVYYVVYPGESTMASLYKISILGGTPVKLIDDVDSPVTFSPDRTRFAFNRGVVSRGTVRLIVADADGSNHHVLASSPPTALFQQREAPSWSPDGRTILVTAMSSRPGAPALIQAVDAQAGTTATVGGPWAILHEVAWLPDGRSFLVTGLDLSGSSTQIWRVSYPDGERSRVTNDLNAYTGVSVSGDGRSIATVQSETEASVYVAEGPDREPRRVTTGAARADGTFGLAWLPDGRLVYTSTASGNPQIWMVDGDGANAHQLTSQATVALSPRASPDGAWIYFTSYANGAWGVFRIAPDGTGLQRIATSSERGDGMLLPLSPDGRSIYFTSTSTGVPHLMRVATANGAPEQVSSAFFQGTDISPDGAHACGFIWDEKHYRLAFAIMDLSTGAVVVQPDSVFSTSAAMERGLLADRFYLADGRLARLDRIAGKSIVRVSSVADAEPKAVTPESDELLFFGAASRDGRIAFSRGQTISDVVSIGAK